MGVVPNALDGITPDTLQGATAVGTGAGNLPDLYGYSQPTAENLLKQLFVVGNPALSDPLAAIFSGLRQGISLPLAILEALAKKLFGLPDDFTFLNVDHVLSALKRVPILSDLIEAVTGVEDGDLNDLGTWALGIRNWLQSLGDAIVSALTGGLTTSSDPAAIAWAIFNRIFSLPGQLFEGMWSQLANLQSQVTALQNNPGTGLSDDFRLVDVSGWTGTLTLSTRGRYIQSPSRTWGYRNTGPATDRHGAQMIVTAKMRGVVRLGICSDTAASNYAALELYSGFDGDAVRLVTGSSPSLVAAQDQIDFVIPRTADLTAWDIWYDPTANIFHIARNGQDVLTREDIENIVTHGSAKRRIIVVSNGLDSSADGMYGFGIQQVTAYDR